MYRLGLLTRALPPEHPRDARVETPVSGFLPLAVLHNFCCVFGSKSASEKSAFSTIAPSMSLDVNTTRFRIASVKFAPTSTERSINASLMFAPVKSTSGATIFIMYAPRRFAPRSLANRMCSREVAQSQVFPEFFHDVDFHQVVPTELFRAS